MLSLWSCQKQRLNRYIGIYDGLKRVGTNAFDYTVTVKKVADSKDEVWINGRIVRLDKNGTYIDNNPNIHFEYNVRFEKDSLHIYDRSGSLGGSTEVWFNGRKRKK